MHALHLLRLSIPASTGSSLGSVESKRGTRALHRIASHCSASVERGTPNSYKLSQRKSYRSKSRTTWRCASGMLSFSRLVGTAATGGAGRADGPAVSRTRIITGTRRRCEPGLGRRRRRPLVTGRDRVASKVACRCRVHFLAAIQLSPAAFSRRAIHRRGLTAPSFSSRDATPKLNAASHRVSTLISFMGRG